MNSFLKYLPDFKGKRRLARLFFGKLISRGDTIETAGKFNCTYFLPNLKENLAFDIFINGLYEEDTHQLLMSRIPANGIFLDLGANIGSISLPLCKRRKDIRCVAVEAVPWIFDFLNRNIEVNHLTRSIEAINFALKDVDEEELPFYTTRNNFGKGSLSPIYTTKEFYVKTKTIDSIAQSYFSGKVDMIKIDIEGYEYFAFKGGETLLQDTQAPEILFEFVDWAEKNANLNPGEAQRLLLNMGYKLYALHTNGKIKPLKAILTAGSAMLFASKNSI